MNGETWDRTHSNVPGVLGNSGPNSGWRKSDLLSQYNSLTGWRHLAVTWLQGMTTGCCFHPMPWESSRTVTLTFISYGFFFNKIWTSESNIHHLYDRYTYTQYKVLVALVHERSYFTWRGSPWKSLPQESRTGLQSVSVITGWTE